MADEKIQSYPRSLYKGGDRDAEQIVVTNEAEEKKARKQGFACIGDPGTPQGPAA